MMVYIKALISLNKKVCVDTFLGWKLLLCGDKQVIQQENDNCKIEW